MSVSSQLRRVSHPLVAILLALGIATSVAVVTAASPAAAHDQIMSSNPADKAKLDTAPKQLTLTFSEAPMKDSAKIIASSRDGQPVLLDEPTIKGKEVTVPWPTQNAGTYGVNWRVVSSDGHPINGTFAFQVLGSTSSTTAPVESPSDSTVTTQATPTEASSESQSNVRGMIAGLAAAIVAATILVAILGRRRRDKDDDAS